MSDTKESMPAQPTEKPTVNIEKPPAWAIAMSEKIARGFEDTNARLSGVETTMDTLVEDGKAANQRMTKIEIRLDNYENRASNTSERVRGESEVNLKQDAAIAMVLEKVKAIADKPDTAAVVLSEVRALAAKPAIQKLGAALLPVLLLAISAIGIKLQFAVTKLEERPAAVQPAATVYLPAPVDGGAQ